MTLIFKRPVRDLIDGPECGTGLGACNCFFSSTNSTRLRNWGPGYCSFVFLLVRRNSFDLSSTVMNSMKFHFDLLRSRILGCHVTHTAKEPHSFPIVYWVY